ncbi:MAG: amidohydrolase family protein, partial [Caldilineales bacterium]|nr:amidohydrolase family protein [Caldilineales bacterium]
PVFILRTDGHIALANAAAFRACGVPEDAADPPFGRFDRHPDTGRFTGLVRETAAHPFLGQIHASDAEDEIAEGLERVFAECLSYGITSVYNSLTPARAIRAYQRMRDTGRLRLRVGIIASGREDGLIEALIAAGIRTGFGDDWVRVIGVEWCPDCSTSGRTAAYYEPYVGAKVVGEVEDNRGMLLYEADDLKRRAIAAHKAGLLVCIEGVGDRGIDFALDAIEAALAAHPDAQAVANWMNNALQGALGDATLSSLSFGGAALGRLAALVEEGVLSATIAKDVLAEMVQRGADPDQIVAARGLRQISDAAALAPIIARVIAENPEKVAAYRSGRPSLIGFFMGQVMRHTGGKANPQLARELMEQALG